MSKNHSVVTVVGVKYVWSSIPLMAANYRLKHAERPPQNMTREGLRSRRFSFGCAMKAFALPKEGRRVGYTPTSPGRLAVQLQRENAHGQ
jgi:hypothetical protein